MTGSSISMHFLFLLLVFFLTHLLASGATPYPSLAPFGVTPAPDAGGTYLVPASAPSSLPAPAPAPVSPGPSAPARPGPSTAPSVPVLASPAAEGAPASKNSSDTSKNKPKDGQSPFMEAIAAKRHGAGRKEGIIAGVAFSCILVVLVSTGTAYIYVTRKYNIDRSSSFRSEIAEGRISAASPL